MFIKQNSTTKGFTLIELLVVIAIIALLSTLAVVSLNNARAKSRDAKRVADVKQMQTALELYFADQSGYPGATFTGASPLGSANASCLGPSSAGFTSGTGTCGATTYMGQVPSNPTPTATATTSYGYVPLGTVDALGHVTTYNIVFGLEGQTGSLAAGTHTATPPTGIQ